MATRRRMDSRAIEVIKAQMQRGVDNAAEIRRAIQRLAEQEADLDVPHQRTVERAVRDLRRAPLSTPWTVADAQQIDRPEDLESVAEAVRSVITESEGRRFQVSVAEAEWIASLARMVPELHPWTRSILAGELAQRAIEEASTDDIDVLLTFVPWRSQAHRERYFGALDQGWLPGTKLDHLTLAAFVLGPAALDSETRRTVINAPWDALSETERDFKFFVLEIERRFNEQMSAQRRRSQPNGRGERDA